MNKTQMTTKLFENADDSFDHEISFAGAASVPDSEWMKETRIFNSSLETVLAALNWCRTAVRLAYRQR